MGLEAICRARAAGQECEGKAHLDSAELTFRGDVRFRIPLASIRKIRSTDETLFIGYTDGDVELDLGPAAGKWLQKIQNPPTLFDKLGLKRETAVAALHMRDAAFLRDLQTRCVQSPPSKADVILLGIEDGSELDRIAILAKVLQPHAAIWTIFPKGQKHIKQSDVMQATKAAGLVDVKVASFSATHTAMKMVIPVAKRAST
jgi:hypothetical protein